MRRRMRDPLITAPNRAATAASSNPWAHAGLTGAADSRKATTTAPIDWPSTRAVPSAAASRPGPLAPGLRTAGARLLGDWKKPNPAPHSAMRPDNVELRCESPFEDRLSPIRPQANRRQTYRPPSTPAEYRSDKPPASGAAKHGRQRPGRHQQPRFHCAEPQRALEEEGAGR